jgi:hypothetical protein
MGDTQRTRALAVAACAVASVAVLVAYLGGSPSRRVARLAAAPAAHSTASTADSRSPPAAARPVAQPQPAVVASSCPGEALVPVGGARDGLFQLQPALSPDAKASALVTVAREAQQQGRVRDAEVALIAACHAAEREGGPRSAPLADVKAQLGQHYLDLGAREADAPRRLELHHRAESLWAQSADAYAASLGRNASKTRIAKQRLASLEQVVAANPATASMGAAGATSPATERAANAVANLPVPALVRSDPELAQLESDIGRLQEQARRVSRDPAGLRRRESQALAQRDARCQDKACLVRWYAQRRRQLLAEF